MANSASQSPAVIQNPCPDCLVQLTEIKKSGKALTGFPLYFTNQSTVTNKATALREYATHFISDKELKSFMARLEIFRNPDLDTADFIAKNHLEALVQQAFLWEETVKAIQENKIQISCKIESGEGEIGRAVAFAELQGGLKLKDAGRWSLSTPRMTEIVKSGTQDNQDFSIHFANSEGSGQNVETTILIKNGYKGLIAFILDGSQVSEDRKTLIKKIQLTLNTNRVGAVVMTFVSDTALQFPPNWAELGR